MDIEDELNAFLDHELEYVDRATHVILAWEGDGSDFEPIYVMPGEDVSNIANRICGAVPCVRVFDLKTKKEFTQY